MKIKIWGCRGSIATPGPHTLRYGGNTTCLEIRSAMDEVVIVDAGSGLRLLGKALRADPKASRLRFFFTHSHWDHVAGFPFFEPAYLRRFSISFCGGAHAQDTIRKYLTHQMQAPYFPMEFSVLKAEFNFGCRKSEPGPGACCFDALEVLPIPMSHPNGAFGYRFADRGKAFVFLTDNELGFQHPGGLTTAQYAEFCRGTDLLFHDAQYTDEDYKLTRGWGHSTFADAVDLALAAGVRRLGLFHHDPDRTDLELDRQVDWCRERVKKAGSSLDCFACAEGMEFEV